jgi:hypothetical protein
MMVLLVTLRALVARVVVQSDPPLDILEVTPDATRSLSFRYSSGTSSSGTWRVVTSKTSGSLAFSTPSTIEASKEFPSSTNSSTLAEADSTCPHFGTLVAARNR